MGWLRRPIGSLGAYAGGRDNNFNLIRFLAASAVLLSHSFALAVGRSSAEPLRALLGTTLGQIAVDVFFLTSGFLVMASLISASRRLVKKPALSLKQRDGRTTDSGLNAAKLSKGSNVR